MSHRVPGGEKPSGSVQPVSSMRRWALNRAGLPFRLFFDRRFESIVDEMQRLREDEQRMSRRLENLERGLPAELQSVAEVLTLQTRNFTELGARLEATANNIEPVIADTVVRTFVDRKVEDLTEGLAQLLNFATSHRGFAAQRGLWFNPAVWVTHRERMVGVDNVTERIVEVPYVLAAAAALPSGSHILDVGAAESTNAFALASSGHDVVAIDLHPYPLEHPRLTSVTEPIERWPAPARRFDMVISLSTIEHIGLPAYESETIEEHLDRRIVERIGDMLAPEGTFVMTAPYGRWHIDAFERVYDAAHLDALLEGWEIVDRRYARHAAPLVWVTLDDPLEDTDWGPDGKGVVLLQARPRR